MIQIDFSLLQILRMNSLLQTPRKQLQSIGISPVNLHAFMKNLKSNISEVHKVQVDSLKDSNSYDKNDTKKKVNDLIRLHEAIQQKLK